MNHIRKAAAFCGAATLLALSTASITTAHGRQSVKVLLRDLNSPKGLALDAEKDLVIGQGAFGPPGPVLVYLMHGPDKGTVVEVTDPVNLTDVAVSPKDGTGWGIGPDENDEGHLFHQLADGTVVDVLNIADYQAGDPDPVDHDDPPNPIESNPYGLTVMRNGDALIADAAGNDIIRVTPDGHARTVARFDLQSIKTDHAPPEVGPLPPRLLAEAVPTSVTIGPDGAIYVGELKGFPFRPGTSNVWRIAPNANGAWCSVREPDPTGKCSLYANRFTAIQDIAFNKSDGRLYVYELAKDGVFAFEAGLETGEFPDAVLLEVTKNAQGNGIQHVDRRRELVPGKLSQPGGIVVRFGKVFVTDGVFTSGRLLRIDGAGTG